ncbi:MAG: YwiC-like family protein [Anaerolineales bacterium]
MNSLFRKPYFLPPEHGAWIWFIGPYLLGVAAGGQLRSELLWLLLAGLFAFLLRQPITILVKISAGRRDQRQWMPALIWAIVYSVLGLACLLPLLLSGYAQLLALALPGMLVFGWHLWLVRMRQERRRPGVQIVASGALSLLAPAAFWVAGGSGTLIAVTLWAASWLQAAASIVLIHLRLEQRSWQSTPSVPIRLDHGWRALSYHAFNLAASLVMSAVLHLPIWIPLGFGFMLLDCADGVLRPAVGLRPSAIGIRQALSSAVFLGLAAIGFARWIPAG